jgi:hypothetical protein
MRLILFLVIFLTGAVAYAEGDSEKAAAGASALDYTVSTLGALLGTALIVLLRKGIQVVERRYDIDVPERLELRLEMLADRAIAYAEEQAHKAIKEKIADGGKIDKLGIASGFFLDLLDDAGIRGWAIARAKRFIEARLGQLREDRKLGARLLRS